MNIKARRFYWTQGTPSCGGFPGVAPERVRVTGFALVNGERWCRVRFDGDKTANLLMHPSSLREAA